RLQRLVVKRCALAHGNASPKIPVGKPLVSAKLDAAHKIRRPGALVEINTNLTRYRIKSSKGLDANRFRLARRASTPPWALGIWLYARLPGTTQRFDPLCRVPRSGPSFCWNRGASSAGRPGRLEQSRTRAYFVDPVQRTCGDRHGNLQAGAALVPRPGKPLLGWGLHFEYASRTNSSFGIAVIAVVRNKPLAILGKTRLGEYIFPTQAGKQRAGP